MIPGLDVLFIPELIMALQFKQFEQGKEKKKNPIPTKTQSILQTLFNVKVFLVHSVTYYISIHPRWGRLLVDIFTIWEAADSHTYSIPWVHITT